MCTAKTTGSVAREVTPVTHPSVCERRHVGTVCSVTREIRCDTRSLAIVKGSSIRPQAEVLSLSRRKSEGVIVCAWQCVSQAG